MAGKLAQLKLDAAREGWNRFIRTASDEAALLEGCRFSFDRARYVEQFLNRFCRFTQGRWAGQAFELLEFQRECIVWPLFGWIRPDGRRRFRFADIFLPKKNTKTTLCAALEVYLLGADGEARPEVYGAAVDRSQSKKIYDEAAAIVRASPALRARMKCVDSTKRIVFGGGFFEALSSKSANAEGKNIHGLVIDELHVWNTPTLKRLWAALYYGGIAREQPVSIVISTAGEDPDDEDELWVEIWQRAEDILKGDAIDTRRLPYIAAAGKSDDWTDPATHRKANPGYGTVIDPEEMTASCQEAQGKPRLRAQFLRYRLNRPARTVCEWFEQETWDACSGAVAIPPGSPVYGGLDLSSTSDFTAFVLVGRRPDDSGQQEEAEGTEKGKEERGLDENGEIEDRYHVKPFLFVPEDTIAALEAEGKYRYRTWARAGLIIPTPGNVLDYRFVVKTIVEQSEVYELVECAYDPWNATETAVKLQDEHGITMFECRQGAKTLSEPMKKVERLAKQGKLNHGGHRVMSWMFSNTRVKSDENQNIRPVKENPNSPKKIDGIVGTIMAAGRAMVAPKPKPSVYRYRGIRVIEIESLSGK